MMGIDQSGNLGVDERIILRRISGSETFEAVIFV
jgi:hypothetical protein